MPDTQGLGAIPYIVLGFYLLMANVLLIRMPQGLFF